MGYQLSQPDSVKSRERVSVRATMSQENSCLSEDIDKLEREVEELRPQESQASEARNVPGHTQE